MPSVRYPSINVEPVPLGWLMYQPHVFLKRSRARVAFPIAKWAWSSKLVMKGEILFGNSGLAGPMSVQYSWRRSEMSDVMFGYVTLNRMAKLLASCGYRVVDVALSR